MSLTRDEVIRYLEGLPAEELGTLADDVLRRLGMPPIVPPERPLQATGGIQIIDTFDVVLRGHGQDKLAVVKIVRRLLGLGLADAIEVVESAPVDLRRDLERVDARALADELRLAGADVVVR